MTPGAEKADARNHVGHDLRGPCMPAEPHADVDESRRAHRHEDVGPQPRIALPVLPFRTDQGAEAEGHEKNEG